MTRTIAAFRAGQWRTSLDTEELPGGLGGLRLALVPEIVADADRQRWAARAPALPAPDPAERRELVLRAVELFRHGTVTVGGLGAQSAESFRTALWETAGVPAPLTVRWGAMLRASAADRPVPDADDALALVALPGNTFTCLDSVLDQAERSAAVWVRPSRREPLSAARLIGALLAVGWPPERLGLYPTARRALPGLILRTDRQIVYGGSGLAASVRDRPSLTLHGPGRGCALVPAGLPVAEAVDWLLPLIAADAGRFCRNVRTVVCEGDPGPLAAALATALDAVGPGRADAEWPLTVFREPRAAERAVASVTAGLGPGDRLLTRGPVTVAHPDGGVYALPRLVLIGAGEGEGDGGPAAHRPEHHPLVGHEVPFPFAAVLRAGKRTADAVADASLFVYRAPDRKEHEAAHDH
ncbi:hypothetical protein [Streptomyces sp. NBC_01508]|uniref:hypothetical protein n=1 Tax=Streptomyces sp. NBC_01508 TaxID=2903888 RepID=UPI00386814BF